MKLSVVDICHSKGKEKIIEIEVDDKIFHYLNKFKWRVKSTGYGKLIMANIASPNSKREIYAEIGTMILGVPENTPVQRISNTYDYRKENLCIKSWGGTSTKKYNSKTVDGN